MLGSVVDVVLAVAAVAGIVFGTLEHLGKKAAEARADRMAEELANAREELTGARLAQERLASVEEDAARYARRTASRTASTQRSRDRAEDRARRREERTRKSHEKKMLGEEKKQTKAAEKLAKEARRRKK